MLMDRELLITALCKLKNAVDDVYTIADEIKDLGSKVKDDYRTEIKTEMNHIKWIVSNLIRKT